MGTGTGRRAEIKGRRGDEFVKKAEAGQRHASGTSKRQDEMKSNRRHPARKNLLSSCPRSRSFIRFPFPRSFRPARRKLSSFFIPSLLAPSFLFLSPFRVPSRYFISVPPLTRCKRVKEAEKARVRPERARGGVGLWNPLREVEDGGHEHHPSRNFSAVVSKAPLIFLCDGMQSRVINRMFVLLTVEQRASLPYYNVDKQQKMNTNIFKKTLKKAALDFLVFSFYEATLILFTSRFRRNVIVAMIMINYCLESTPSNRIDTFVSSLKRNSLIR